MAPITVTRCPLETCACAPASSRRATTWATCSSVALSRDEDTLYVGTASGLVALEANTGELMVGFGPVQPD
jgi:hypothetical protein